MPVPTPQRLIVRLRAVPAASALIERLGDRPDVHLVGGAVRDLLLDRPPLDLDLVVEGDPAPVAEALGQARTYDQFGTSTVVLGDHTYDLARARTETYARPGALPDVEWADLASDLLRRDFTVNALAVTLGGPEAGTLHAAPHGLDDLEHRRLRVFHDRSFLDDPTRLLRLARYAARLGFEVEPGTRALAVDAARGGALGTVSGARLGTELRLAAREPDPVAAFAQLSELGAAPGLAPGFGLGDPGLARRALALLPGDGRVEVLIGALSTLGMADAERRELIERLGYEAGARDAILAAASGAAPVADALDRAQSASAIAAALAAAPPELVALAGALGPADVAARWLQELRHVRLEIDGNDLRAAGVGEGPAIGAGLRAALAGKLDGRVRGRAQELGEALRAAGVSG